MALIGRHEWLMNMVRTAQENRTGAETKEKKKMMKVSSYESLIFQHDKEDLRYAMWADNNIVRTLSNFHSPEILEAGLKRKRKVNKKRERHQTNVPCPHQNKDNSDTFHLIDKGNGAKAKYNLFLENKKHGWTPKLALRFFNMTLNNAYKIYRWLLAKYNPGRRVYGMGEAVTEAAHAFLQRGDSMRKQQAEHPAPVRSVVRVFDTGVGGRSRRQTRGARTNLLHAKNKVDVHTKVVPSESLRRKRESPSEATTLA